MNTAFELDPVDSRRKSARRTTDNCVSVIDGKAYPVENWSNGGVMVHADDRIFSLHSSVDVTLKFRLSDKIIDVAHRGKIVRKMRDKLAIQFEPFGRDVSDKFKRVVDDFVTREFANSQMI